MKHQKISPNEFLIKLEVGDDILESMKKFAEELKIEGGVFQGIGAVQKARLRVYNTKTKSYEDHEVNEQCEIISLIGNIAKLGKEIIIHAHMGLGKKDLNQIGGHVDIGCIVNPMAEIYFKSFDKKIEREKDPATGLNMLKF